jgi:sulfide:quinone oxidoreductase
LSARTDKDGFRVVIAGGGIAGLEALLALRELVGDRVAVDVLAPEDEFVVRQLAVAEPFSAGEANSFDLTDLVSRAGGNHRHDSLAEVRPGERVVVTGAGAQIEYDALLLAIGARPVEALPGAITYRGFPSNADVRRAVLDVDQGEISSIGFAVPVTVRWALPLYELALLSAAHLREIGDRDVEIHFVTHEIEPLGLFGSNASRAVRDLLAEAGINLHTQAAPARVREGRILLQGGGAIRSDRVVAMPGSKVSEIPGIPQGPRGFIGTDREMRVEGLTRVYAAGDATWFPINQGGLAAQQADSAASAIASIVDPAIEPEPFAPVLRGAILTGSGPRYLRGGYGRGGESDSAASRSPLWWPPSKVAGRHLAPFLASITELSIDPAPALADLEPPLDDQDERAAADHDDAVALCFASAESDARWGDYENALRWIATAEKLAITIPPEYAVKREQWREAAGAARVP